MKFPIIGVVTLHVSAPVDESTPEGDILQDAVEIVPDAGEPVGITDVWVELSDDERVYGTIDVRVRITVRDGFSQTDVEGLVLEAIDVHPKNGRFEGIMESSALGIENQDGTIKELDFATVDHDDLREFEVGE